jgi:hypothetical protein
MYLKTAAIILASASVAVAQDVPATPLDSTTIMRAEQAAVRVALDSSFIRVGSGLVVNPMLIPTGGVLKQGEELALRTVYRTDALAAYLKASTRQRDSVIKCASRTSMGPRCDVVGADAYVSASHPRFDGGLATVTVQIEAQGTRGSLASETLNIVMANTSAGWKVLKLERLGRS